MIGFNYNQGFPLYFLPIFIVVLLWTVFWKGIALWNAAKRREKVWFFVLLIVNTFGLLEIFYIVKIAKIKFSHAWKSLDN